LQAIKLFSSYTYNLSIDLSHVYISLNSVPSDFKILPLSKIQVLPSASIEYLSPSLEVAASTTS
ncbi:hypothetical protein LWT34_23955, partial [Enterobacter ludwigii]